MITAVDTEISVAVKLAAVRSTNSASPGVVKPISILLIVPTDPESIVIIPLVLKFAVVVTDKFVKDPLTGVSSPMMTLFIDPLDPNLLLIVITPLTTVK